jgi:hypothetical protein
MAYWNVREIHSEWDAMCVSPGDTIIAHPEALFVEVSAVLHVPGSGDVVWEARVTSYLHDYKMNHGDIIYWGPRGMAYSLADYVNGTNLIERK